MATIALLAEHGVTRISLGAQSFDARKLRLLERDHQPGDIAHAVELAQCGGLDVSLDLIFGVPGRNAGRLASRFGSGAATGARSYFDVWADFRTGHGVLEPAGAGRVGRGIDEELEREMYESAIDRLSGAGFEHYEVRTSPGPAIAAGTTKCIGPAANILRPGPARRGMSAACARRITAA